MTVLWCGGEDVDFPNGNVVVISTSSANLRTGYARCSLQAPSVSGQSRSNVFSGGAVTSAWIGATVAGSGNTSQNFFGLVKDSSISAGIFAGIDSSTANKLAIIKFDGTTRTVLATEASTSFTNSTANRIALQIINFGAAATINLFLNSNQIATFSGNASISGVTNLSAVSVGGYYGYVSEVIVADTDVRTLSLVTMQPNAAGDANAWTGAYTDINETTINDATVLYTNTASQDAQFNLADIPSGSFTIHAVALKGRVAKSVDATPGSIALGVKSGGTVSAGTAQAITTGFTTIEAIYSNNPVTSAAWAQSDMAALQINVRSAA